MAAYLTLQDLYNVVGSDRVRQLFDDNLNESLTDESASVAAILNAAEAEVASRLKRSWGDAGITALAGADSAMKFHAAWIAMEFASERRPAFLAVDGKGSFWAQYERAIDYFESLAKGKNRSLGETAAGISSQERGTHQPAAAVATDPAFVFAPDNNSPTGHGGF